MSKVLKRTVIICVSVLLALCVVFGVLILVKNLRKKPVKVYAVGELGGYGFYGGMNEAYGEVKLDKMQKVVLSETQTVKEILVKEGDVVKVGDPVLTYDSSLGELDVKKAGINVQRLQLELADKEAELQSYNTALISENIEADIERLEAELEAEENRISGIKPEYPPLPIGDGTEDDPLYIEYDGDFDIYELTDEIAPEEERYIVFVSVEGGEYFDYRGLRFSADESGSVKIGFFDAAPLDGEFPDIDDRRDEITAKIEKLYELLSNSYSTSELIRLKAEASISIKDLEIRIKVAELDYQKKLDEIGDGTVYSKVDGTVVKVNSEGDEYSSLVDISGGGGYYITCPVSEFDLEDINIGDTVSVTSWYSDTVCEGEIVSLDTNNVCNNDNYYDGNSNISWYPVKVFVSAENTLEENDYVSVSFQTGSYNDELMLQNMFIRFEDGKPYVYAMSKTGMLERRFIVTGVDMYGEYTEIKDGLDESDYIAFPYGADVTEGAETVKTDVDDLYGDDYGIYY
ncbi:MAG: efflux RND transporter periplasmic adaptor subunit [Clostridia bacterium]|nr:efflux RND transporter periplasmic adaptor subunit [Clostridia bacterium]